MNENLLSVIIPAFNAEKYLEEAVNSVRRQRWIGEMEILLVDDGSADGTVALAQKLGCKVMKKEHGGAAAARNVGIRTSSGAWILLLDADDRLCDNALEALYQPFEKSPETSAVFGRAEDFISPELSLEQSSGLKMREGSYEGVLPGCSLIRRSTFDGIGLFDESLKSGETVDWMMRLRSSGMETVKIETTTLCRRLHLSNTGRVNPRQEMMNYANLLRKRMKKT